MTHSTHNETPPLAGESASGQTSGLGTRDDTTSLTTLQHRVANIRLKARIPGACIALEIPGPIQAQLLTIDEARQLIGALASLIGDIEADLRARAWSEQSMRELFARRPDLARLYEQANGAPESYHSKL